MTWVSFVYNFPSAPAVLCQGIFLYYNLLDWHCKEVCGRVFCALLENPHTYPMLCKIRWLLQIGFFKSKCVWCGPILFFPCNNRVNFLRGMGIFFFLTAEDAATSKIKLVTIKIIFNRVVIYKLLFFGWLYTDVYLKEEVHDFHLDNFMLIANYMDGRNVK